MYVYGVPNIRTVRNYATRTLPSIVNNFLNVQLDMIRFNMKVIVDFNSFCDLSIKMDILWIEIEYSSSEIESSFTEEVLL